MFACNCCLCFILIEFFLSINVSLNRSIYTPTFNEKFVIKIKSVHLKLTETRKVRVNFRLAIFEELSLRDN